MGLFPTFALLVQEATGERAPRSGLDLVKRIRDGLPAVSVENFVRIGKLTNVEVDKIVLPRKTLAHRKEIGKLTAEQGDRLRRVARIIALAEDTFGSKEKAGIWLRRPTTALAGEAPLALLDTEEGAKALCRSERRRSETRGRAMEQSRPPGGLSCGGSESGRA